MRQNNTNMYLFAGIVIVLAVLGAAVFFGLPIPQSKASVVTSVSTINYDSNSGQVKSGYLYGSKIVAGMALTDAPAELRILLKGTQTTWGQYTIKPQNNMLIKTSASSKAESPLQEYRRAYYMVPPAYIGDTTPRDVLQTKELKGTTWSIYTPIHIDIFADANAIPTTKILSKDILGTDLDGQQLIALGNGFNIQKVNNINTGAQQLPTVDNIVVATAPDFADLRLKVLSDYSATTYIFDRASYESRVEYFRLNDIGYNNPLMALWTGYDKYEFYGIGGCSGITGNSKNGYCNVSTMTEFSIPWRGMVKPNAWNGLINEVTQPTYNIRYDATASKLIAEPIQYGAQVNFEIPSENVQSLAVLRGAGTPEVTYSVTNSMNQGTSYYLTVTVKNTGDTDGFTIVPTPRAGKVLFTPASYTSQNIPAGESRVFKFVMTVAGQETSVKVGSDTVDVTVTPEHNLDARVTKTFMEVLNYKTTSETSPDNKPNLNPTAVINPTGSDTMNLTNSGDGKGSLIDWYQTPQAILLGFLMACLVMAGYYRFRMVKK